MRRYIVLLVGLQGCGSARSAAPDFSRDSRARKAAVQEVSDEAVAGIVASNRPAMLLVVQNRVLWFADSTGPAMSRPAWRDFVRNAREPGVVPVLGFDSAVNFLVVDRWELQGDVTDTALVALSGVGLSPSGDEAVVYMDYRCGTRCGTVAIGTFRRRGDRWVLSKADTISRH